MIHSASLTIWQAVIDPPGHGRIGGYYFHAGCPSVRHKNKYALRRTPCMKIMTTYWLGPGGSLWSLPTCFRLFLISGNGRMICVEKWSLSNVVGLMDQQGRSHQWSTRPSPSAWLTMKICCAYVIFQNYNGQTHNWTNIMCENSDQHRHGHWPRWAK